MSRQPRWQACRVMVRVVGRDGRDLLGSPLDPGAERRSAAAVDGSSGTLYPANRRRAGRGRSVGEAAPSFVRGGRRCRRRSAGRRAAAAADQRRGAGPWRAGADPGLPRAVLATAGVTSRSSWSTMPAPSPRCGRISTGWRRPAASGCCAMAENRGFPAAANAGMRRLPRQRHRAAQQRHPGGRRDGWSGWRRRRGRRRISAPPRRCRTTPRS